MKKRISKILILFVVTLIILPQQACDDMLSLSPPDNLTRDEFWQSEEDVEGAIIGCYNGLQGLLISYFMWGEARGELVGSRNVGHGFSVSANPNSQFFNHLITEENKYCSWKDVYSNINKINTVLKFAPLAKERDDVFTVEKEQNYIGEAKFMRALMYFYLVRSFRDVPLVLKASLSDEQSYMVKQSPPETVLDTIEADLIDAVKMLPENYNWAEDREIRNIGRATKYAAYSLLADVYLWRYKYKEALECTNAIINSKKFALVSGGNWFDIFFPGNSSEGIFELQFSYADQEKNDMIQYFSDKEGAKIEFYVQQDKVFDNYSLWDEVSGTTGADAVRGENKTYKKLDEYDAIVWKWAGADAVSGNKYRSASQLDANWIFYRYSDIILMKAEALNGLNRTGEALNELNIIRERASLKTIEGLDRETTWKEILAERGRELAFEGKRWFDLVRFAFREGNPRNKEYVIEVISKALGGYFMDAVYKARLYEDDAWYLPISRSELQVNSELKQNPYYKVD